MASHPGGGCWPPSERLLTEALRQGAPRAFATGEPLDRGQLFEPPALASASDAGHDRRRAWPQSPERARAARRRHHRRPPSAPAAHGFGGQGHRRPHDRRERHIVVYVETIRSRPVRRRGMRPMVEASLSDGTGRLQAAFFNQPWLVDRYRPGTRLLVQGVVQPGGKLRLSGHAPTQLQPGSAEGAATYPATDGIGSTQIAALVAQHLPAPGISPRRSRADAGRPGPLRRRRRLHRHAPRRDGGRSPAARVRGAARRPARAATPPRHAPRRPRRRRRWASRPR